MLNFTFFSFLKSFDSFLFDLLTILSASFPLNGRDMQSVVTVVAVVVVVAVGKLIYPSSGVMTYYSIFVYSMSSVYPNT